MRTEALGGQLLQLLPPGSAPEGLTRKPLVLSGGQMEQRTQRLQAVASSIWATQGGLPLDPESHSSQSQTRHAPTHSFYQP